MRSPARSAVLSAVAAVTALASACSATPPSASSRTGGASRASAPATTKEQFLPLIVKYERTATWPTGRRLTAEQIWDELSGAAQSTRLQDIDAQDAVGVWSACAWVLDYVDRAAAARPTQQNVAELRKIAVAFPDLAGAVGAVLTDVDAGSTAAASDFIDGNECRTAFPAR
ncbi:MAG TPA: hypothetical protein VE781_06155 [Kineosporiaceae bacterium]|nr:hypothetical protein [Kineosporiaceae bacterium]